MFENSFKRGIFPVFFGFDCKLSELPTKTP